MQTHPTPVLFWMAFRRAYREGSGLRAPNTSDPKRGLKSLGLLRGFSGRVPGGFLAFDMYVSLHVSAAERPGFFFVADLFATGVRRSQCRKERRQLHAVFFARSASSTPESKAAAHWCVSRGWSPSNAINIGGAGERKTKETGTEGSGGREGEQGRPTRSEGSYGCRPQRSRHQHGPGTERGGERAGKPRDSSVHQPQARGQQAGTSASAAARDRCVL